MAVWAMGYVPCACCGYFVHIRYEGWKAFSWKHSLPFDLEVFCSSMCEHFDSTPTPFSFLLSQLPSRPRFLLEQLFHKIRAQILIWFGPVQLIHHNCNFGQIQFNQSLNDITYWEARNSSSCIILMGQLPPIFIYFRSFQTTWDFE